VAAKRFDETKRSDPADLLRRVAVNAALVAIVLVFAQPILVALADRVGRDTRHAKPKGAA
jgi:hypothetical protein